MQRAVARLGGGPGHGALSGCRGCAAREALRANAGTNSVCRASALGCAPIQLPGLYLQDASARPLPKQALHAVLNRFWTRCGSFCAAALACIFCCGLTGRYIGAQPIPLEVMAGTRYASSSVVLSRSFASGSRFGFFHLGTTNLEYESGDAEVTTQDLLFFEPVRGFRIAGGAFYSSVPGLKPTAGLQYLRAGKSWFVLLSPRANMERDPAYSVFTILQLKPPLGARTKGFALMQALSVLNSDGHDFSYQWLRLGLDLEGRQFGLAINLEESSSGPAFQVSAGVFVRREIF